MNQHSSPTGGAEGQTLFVEGFSFLQQFLLTLQKNGGHLPSCFTFSVEKIIVLGCCLVLLTHSLKLVLHEQDMPPDFVSFCVALWYLDLQHTL